MSNSIFFVVAVVIGIISPSSASGFSFNALLQQTTEKLRSVFAPSNKTQLVQKDIKRTTQKTLIVDNKNGSIKIKTDWNQDIISIKAIKKAQDDDLDRINIAIDTKNPDTITLKTVYASTDVAGSVDYTLMVPKEMTVRLKTSKGNIRVKRFDGHLWATTDTGTIEVAGVSHTITAMVNEWGHITIGQSKGDIQASTNNGDIHIDQAQSSIVASTLKGNIMVQAQQIPATGSITLNSAGNVALFLPEETNAHVRAQALAGNIVSDHYIKLAGQTTKLNQQTWSQLQRNVEGILGTGEAEISLSSRNGGIKLLVSA